MSGGFQLAEMYFLGIDYGGTVTKAGIFDDKGKALSLCSEKTSTVMTPDGKCEISMEKLQKTVFNVIKGAIAEGNISPERIACVGVSGHGKGLYITDHAGRPLRAGILSSDRRAESVAKRMIEDGSSKKAAQMTMQDVSSAHPPAILRWLKENEPSVYKKIGHVFEAKDYIRFILTGKAFAEVTDYSGSGLMDLRTSGFKSEITDIFGIGEIFEALPDTVYSCDNCGGINKKSAEETGLFEGTPVCGGAFDIDACAIALGTVNEGDICTITGTWSINEYISSTPVIATDGTKNSLFAIPGKYLIEQSSPTSAGNLDWVLKVMMGGLSYKESDRLVSESDIGGVIFTPYLYGSNTKSSNSCFTGLSAANTRGDIVRAVYEGVAFSHKLHINALLNHRNRPEFIKLGGGVANSGLWTQMFSDILGLTVVTSDSKELGALGVAMCGAVCTGVYKDLKEASDKMSSEGRTFYPDKNNTERYEIKFKDFLKAAEYESK